MALHLMTTFDSSFDLNVNCKGSGGFIGREQPVITKSVRTKLRRGKIMQSFILPHYNLR
jgi:hypothetical protein